jgi:hypothetical protein
MRNYTILLRTVLFISCILHARMLWYQWDRVLSGSGDFVAYYTAGKIVHSGNFRDLADFEVQREYQRQLELSGQSEFLPFYHAPYQALIFWPLSYFSYPIAHLIWSVLTAALLALLFACLIPFIDRGQRVLLGLILIATYPTWLVFVKGQDSVLSALIIVGVFASLKLRHEILTGILLALGLYKPQLVLPMAGILVIGRHWRASVSFVVTGLFLTTISLLMVSWNGAIGLIFTVASTINRGILDYSVFMPNFRGLIYTFFTPLGVSTALPVLTAIISLGLYAGCVALCKDTFEVSHHSFDLQFSLTIVTTLLINPHSHAYELVMLSIALILLFNYVLHEKNHTRYFCNLFLTVLFFFCIPIVPNVMVNYGLMGLGALPLLILYLSIATEIRSHTTRLAFAYL